MLDGRKASRVSGEGIEAELSKSNMHPPSPRSRSMKKTITLALIMIAGLMVTGCTSEHIRNIDSAAKTLRKSDEFIGVNFQYERGFDPMTRPRQLYDFSAALEHDADFDQAGELLAQSVEKSGKIPDVLLDDSTWLMGFYDHTGIRDTADLTAEGWSGVLRSARATHAQELEVWDYESYYAEQYNEHGTQLAFKVHADTYATGLDEFEELASIEAPDEIGGVHVELYAGTDGYPRDWQPHRVGERATFNSAAPIQITGALDSKVWKARELIDAAEQHFDELYGFTFHTTVEAPHLEVTHNGPHDQCEENKAFVPKAEEILGEDVSINISRADNPIEHPWPVYHEVSDIAEEQGAISNGCDPLTSS